MIQFRNDMTADLVRHNASDRSVADAARVSTIGSQASESESNDSGLINFLMRERHGSPFEHNQMTFLVSAPIFVWREHMRHRVGFSYNEESGRYKKLEPVFYLPDNTRNVVQQGKAGKYEFVAGTNFQYALIASDFRHVCEDSYDRYERLMENGVAREVARMLLPLNIYSSAYVTLNARSLMNFLSLRTKAEYSMFPSYPQREIEMVALGYEAHFAELMPDTYSAFVKNGRVAP